MATTEELRQAFVAGAEWIIRRSTGRVLGYQSGYAKAEAEERYPSNPVETEDEGKQE